MSASAASESTPAREYPCIVLRQSDNDLVWAVHCVQGALGHGTTIIELEAIDDLRDRLESAARATSVPTFPHVKWLPLT